MHKEMRATDVQWLAGGWWRQYHKHRALNEARVPGIMAAVTVVLGVVLIIIGIIGMPPPGHDVGVENPPWTIAMVGVGGVVLVVALVLYFRADQITRNAEDRFTDYVLDQWEQGERALPDIETVAEYLKQQELRR